MKKNLIGVFLFYSFAIQNAFSALPPVDIKADLLEKYSKNYNSKSQLAELKKITLNYSGESVSALIEVMKNGKYPDKNRWVATFLLGQIMGDKSAPFLEKFLSHPHWIMRMASLKTLLILKQKQYAGSYARLLNDDSLIVRWQALENIKQLKISSDAPSVWAMLYDKKNYYRPILKGKPLANKRSNIIKKVIETIGELKFDKAEGPLLVMVQKDKYNDIFAEMDTALTQITGKKSPESSLKEKRKFWKTIQISNPII